MKYAHTHEFIRFCISTARNVFILLGLGWGSVCSIWIDLEGWWHKTPLGGVWGKHLEAVKSYGSVTVRHGVWLRV